MFDVPGSIAAGNPPGAKQASEIAGIDDTTLVEVGTNVRGRPAREQLGEIGRSDLTVTVEILAAL